MEYSVLQMVLSLHQSKLGAAMIIKQDDCLVEYKVESFRALSPLQAEVQALCMVYEALQERGILSATIYTDRQVLVGSSNSDCPPFDIDWRVYSKFVRIWSFLRSNPCIKCCFIGRENNSVAHQLAN